TFVGIAPATVLSVSYSGELAYEIHVPNAQLYAAYLALRAAGEAHGMTLFGSRAVESMRIEKGYLHWKSDILTEFDPFETGLARFVRMEKGAFVGKEALARRQAEGPRRAFVTLDVACDDRAAHGGASVMIGDRVVGTVTSGDWGHRTGLNLAMAFVEPQLAAPGTEVEIDMLGTRFRAVVIPAGPYDPDYTRVRA
ncbi:MAG: glycine cleavage T C-terminal barrel domain-containing protein, partial [Pseudomonadota bacterium]